MPNPQEKAEAEAYLTSLLNKNLRVTTTDSRMFLGQFKCTDSDQNIILAQTFEYRIPPPSKQPTSTSSPSKTITQDLTSRYLGLVVVPGEYITKIEVERFESQLSAMDREMYVEREEREEMLRERGACSLG